MTQRRKTNADHDDKFWGEDISALWQRLEFNVSQQQKIDYPKRYCNAWARIWIGLIIVSIILKWRIGIILGVIFLLYTIEMHRKEMNKETKHERFKVKAGKKDDEFKGQQNRPLAKNKKNPRRPYPSNVPSDLEVKAGNNRVHFEETDVKTERIRKYDPVEPVIVETVMTEPVPQEIVFQGRRFISKNADESEIINAAKLEVKTAKIEVTAPTRRKYYASNAEVPAVAEIKQESVVNPRRGLSPNTSGRSIRKVYNWSDNNTVKKYDPNVMMFSQTEKQHKANQELTREMRQSTKNTVLTM